MGCRPHCAGKCNETVQHLYDGHAGLEPREASRTHGWEARVSAAYVRRRSDGGEERREEVTKLLEVCKHGNWEWNTFHSST